MRLPRLLFLAPLLFAFGLAGCVSIPSANTPITLAQVQQLRTVLGGVSLVAGGYLAVCPEPRPGFCAGSGQVRRLLPAAVVALDELERFVAANPTLGGNIATLYAQTWAAITAVQAVIAAYGVQ